jgi:hypothetical protein
MLGCCLYQDRKGPRDPVFAVYVGKFSLPVLVHELYHMTHLLMGHHYVKPVAETEEIYCLLQEHLLDQVLKQLPSLK